MAEILPWSPLRGLAAASLAAEVAHDELGIVLRGGSSERWGGVRGVGERVKAWDEKAWDEVRGMRACEMKRGRKWRTAATWQRLPEAALMREQGQEVRAREEMLL